MSLLAVLPAAGLSADTPASPAANRAEAYFNYSMGHLYAELAASYGNRGEHLSRAIEYYKAAMKADNESTWKYTFFFYVNQGQNT